MSLEELMLTEKAKEVFLNTMNSEIQRHLYRGTPFLFLEQVCETYKEKGEYKKIVDIALDRYYIYKRRRDDYQSQIMAMQDAVLNVFEIASIKNYYEQYFDGNVEEI